VSKLSAVVVCSLGVGLLNLSSGLAVDAWADVTYQQETKMGGMMAIATMGKTMRMTTRIAGDKMRTDNDDRVQITDVAAEKIYELDVKKKTYTVMTFEEMRKRMEQALAGAKAKTEEAPKKDGQDIAASASVKVTDTGNQQPIAGYASRQYLLQTDLNLKDKESGQQGTISSVMDVWLTKDAPGGAEINAFHMKMAQKMGTTELGRQMFQASQQNDYAEGMKRLGTELRKLEGFGMRTVFYMGSAEAAKADALAAAKAPPAAEAPAKKEEDKKQGGGLGGLLSRMKTASGGEGQGGQGGIMSKMTMETVSIDVKPIDPSFFKVPEDFKQVETKR